MSPLSLPGLTRTTTPIASAAASRLNAAGAIEITPPSHNQGFSLVEVTAAMAASLILVLGFSTVILFSRKQLGDTAVRVGLGYDQVLMDKYIRTKLTTTMSDSMQIFASASDEANNITSTSGPILRAVDADSTVYHLDMADGTLLWMVDSTIHNPVDCEIDGLLFTERTGTNSKTLTVNMSLCQGGDTLAAEWSMTLRN